MTRGVRLYRWLLRAGRARRGSVLAIFFFTIGFRLLLSWVLPHPQPSSHDEFSYLLGADIFAHGQAAARPHPLWKFFESVQVISWPVYAPKYPPAQSAFLAAGQVAFHDPFYGVLLSVALFSAAMCWMLQAYVGPLWALLGGVCTALYFGAGHYWTETYWGGAVAGLGAALFIGSYGRLAKGGRSYWGIALGAGAVLLMNSRPYESSVLILSLTLALAATLWRKRGWASWRVLAPAAASLALAAALTLAYNYGVTGNPLKLPYILYMEEYASAPQFWWQPLPAPKHYQNAALELSAQRYDVAAYQEIHSFSMPGRVWQNIATILGTIVYDGGTLALVPLIFVPWFWRRRPIRLFAGIAGIMLVALMLEVVLLLHYLAPLIVVGSLLSFLLLESIWNFRKMRRADRVMLVGLLVVCLLAGPLWRAGRAMTGRAGQLYRGDDFGVRRARIAETILSHPGSHVVFVRFNPEQSPLAAWVANGADLDNQRLVWAHDRGAENAELEQYWKGRTFWLLEDRAGKISLVPYHSLQAQR